MGSGGDSSVALAELILDGVVPLVETVIRGKLHVSLQPDDERRVNQDAIDLVSEVKTLVIARLSKLKSGNKFAAIDNFESYVKTIAINAANHYLREKYPFRLRLKNQLRYLLTHDKRFALWTSDAGERNCGLCEWRDREPDALLESTDELWQKFGESRIAPESIALVDVVAAVFDRVGQSMRFGDLVSLVYKLRNVSEPVEVLEDDAIGQTGSDSDNGPLERLEQSAFLKKLWNEIGQLPLKHRAALLLNLSDGRGDALITVFPLMRIASIRQIAENLEIPIETFACIWSELSWDDLKVAEHLGLTRQQVINLRQSARAMLRRRMGKI